MITVLDVHGNRLQLPANKVKTAYDLKAQISEFFQTKEIKFDIFFDKKVLNLIDPLPADLCERPFIIIYNTVKNQNMIFNPSIRKGRFDNLFLRNCIISPESSLDNSSLYTNYSSSSSNSDIFSDTTVDDFVDFNPFDNFEEDIFSLDGQNPFDIDYFEPLDSFSYYSQDSSNENDSESSSLEYDLT
ncbi:hypothetical protein M9Y10_001030 [Tritrichomonas musculus]|uniref:Ubiquitin-like domain-containing protein n=1 Tax=Tritrichomonas musculus TaxID=1915356 RepID=A0ABR2L5X0_9EUKA